MTVLRWLKVREPGEPGPYKCWMTFKKIPTRSGGVWGTRVQRRNEWAKNKARRGDAPGLWFSERKLLVLIEGEGEVEDYVADGDSERKLEGARVAGEPEFAGGFLTRGKIGGFQGYVADGGRFEVESEIIIHGGGVVARFRSARERTLVH